MTVKVNAIAFSHLVKALEEGVYSCKELAEITGLHYVTVLDYCRALHRVKAIHIYEWEKDCRGRDLIKIYKLGPGQDKKRRKMASVERSAKYREKKALDNQLKTVQGRLVARQSANGRVKYEVSTMQD